MLEKGSESATAMISVFQQKIKLNKIKLVFNKEPLQQHMVEISVC